VRIAFAGGGTGGHLFPGMAVAAAALESGAAESVVFFGAERGIESRVVPEAGYDLIAHPLEGLRGRSPAAAFRAVRRLAGAVRSARRTLVTRRIDVVVGLGGYASAAAVLAARSAGIPIVILEQNRDPGLSNRMFSKLAAAVCTSFEETAASVPRGRARWTGNPVRPELEAPGDPTIARDTLLIFGGSGGAAGVNKAAADAVIELAREKTASLPARIVHQTGASQKNAVDARYAGAGVEADVRAFIDDMAAEYRRARLVVCRSGATTVAELTATGSPAVLVPFPHATGDHQTANARALEKAGAAVVIADDRDASARLAATLTRLLNDPNSIDSMAAAAARMARPGAAARVVEVLQQVAAGSGDTP
jgi:UDP-N-acetylglucosamine--N-acetylmuramyl-(pentapeptide) pyrophosphoryl-undecaprenol N-acetylglucosamine transferase